MYIFLTRYERIEFGQTFSFLIIFLLEIIVSTIFDEFFILFIFYDINNFQAFSLLNITGKVKTHR